MSKGNPPHPFMVLLKQRRKNIGISQDWLAAQMHVSRNSIVDWETGVTRPWFCTVFVRWADLLGYRVELVLKDEGTTQ